MSEEDLTTTEDAFDLDLAEAERWKAERSDKAPVLSLRVT